MFRTLSARFRKDRTADDLKPRPKSSYDDTSSSSNPSHTPVTDSTNLLANESPSFVSTSPRGK